MTKAREVTLSASRLLTSHKYYYFPILIHVISGDMEKCCSGLGKIRTIVDRFTRAKIRAVGGWGDEAHLKFFY